MNTCFRHPRFWTAGIVTLLVAGSIFAWELSLFHLPFLPVIARMPVTTLDVAFAILTSLLLALNVGIVCTHLKLGTCPIGTRRATAVGGLLGGIAFLCPVCLALPGLLLGFGAFLALLAPLVPLLHVVAIIILAFTSWILLR